jgi:hypothetical protein
MFMWKEIIDNARTTRLTLKRSDRKFNNVELNYMFVDIDIDININIDIERFWDVKNNVLLIVNVVVMIFQ